MILTAESHLGACKTMAAFCAQQSKCRGEISIVARDELLKGRHYGTKQFRLSRPMRARKAMDPSGLHVGPLLMYF